MKQILVGTGNKNKLKEIKVILESNCLFDIELVCPKDLGITAEPIENGLSFKDNAYIKARFYHELSGLPTLAEDSGISISYLNDYPGIYSARFCGDIGQENTNNCLLDILDGVKNRSAHYTCVACYIEKDEPKFYEGRFDGEISKYQKEGFGFGYDPIFYLPEYGKNVSEIDVKSKIGHRFQAISKWVGDLK